MGYSGVRNRPGVSAIDMLRSSSSLFVGSTLEGSTDRYEVIELQPGKGGVYGILRRTCKSSGAVFDMALIILISRDRHEFCWKELTEFEGPYETGIPKALFRRLTPLEQLRADESAVNADSWRKAVEADYASQSKRAASKPRVGDVLTFEEPIAFTLDTDEVRIARFQVREWGRTRRLYGLLEDGRRVSCRLHRDTWTHATYCIERAAVTQATARPTAVPITMPEWLITLAKRVIT